MANEILEYVSALDGSQMDIALMDMARHTSEAWAIGERNGLPVGTSDETYENNAKYYAEQAARVVPASGIPAVRYDTPQVLTEAEKQTVRNTINAPNPTELLDLKMLGWTVPKDFAIQNYEENGVFHQRVGRVNLGDLVWTTLQGGSGYYYHWAEVLNRASGELNLICSKYITRQGNEENTIRGNAANSRVYIIDSSYTSSSAFKTAMSGVYLYYELATEITRHIDGGEWGVRYSNPNLLDNWWFGKGVINQRGKASYVGKQYTVDRWAINDNGNNYLEVKDGYVAIGGNPNGCTFYQLVKGLKSGTYTISVNTISATSDAQLRLYSYNSARYIANERIAHSGVFSLTINIEERDVGGNFQFAIATADNGHVDAISAKLEHGSVSTLANDSAPNHTIERLKCQEHYLKYGGDNATLFYGVAISATQARVLINTPVQMDSASLKGTGSFQLYANSALWAITKIEPYSVSPNGVNCTVTISGNGLTDKQMVVGRINGTGSFIELYDPIGA